MKHHAEDAPATPRRGPADVRSAEEQHGSSSVIAAGTPRINYALILGSTLALTAIGLTMVFSTTAINAFGDAEGSTGVFRGQAEWAAVGLLGMMLVSRVRVQLLGALGWVLMALSCVLLVLMVVTPLGVEAGGSTNWIRLGPITGQPSEVAKLALVLWGSTVLTRRASGDRRLLDWLVPIVMPGALVVLTLVWMGGDLGTSLIIILIVGALLFSAGIAKRYLLITAGAALAAVVLLMWTTPYRMMRVSAWLRLNCDHPLGPCRQWEQGFSALTSGGFWGVGLGESRHRSSLPEAEHDFIFSILGEELGLLGAAVVLGLFAVLLLGILRVVAASQDRFIRLIGTGVAVWIAGQAFLNIGMVTGLLPVVGVPLPFISAGGSALTCVLLGVGVLLNFARRQHLDRQSALRSAR
ncbi:FtsW/RodA/SpoVE family cell cycle protein [Nesterenkonia sp. DZ6]|uniref:FtsW/RodA/SpoVE family cell cycle protein n=1 Tax=Nesterenkonia sp. DZ6 TaxID=2901229 RepID=UPI001F4C5F4F|nr:putative peptidoglycan glycosyltransferase FtsW [Nesterenkonia sp. DZ6]MCH8559364.1 putative lipid II flippase FtsW [Nesterenkonia sp. DZ6]